MQKIALPFVACLLAIAAVGAHAQSMWKWRDASGQLHIGDTPPPPGTPAKNIVSSPAGSMLAPIAAPTSTATTTAAADASSAPESDLDKKKKAADKVKADKDKADRAALEQKNAAIRQDNCTRATNEVAGIQAGNRLTVTNTKGEREYLDDAGRAAELKRTQDIAASNCGPAPATPQ
jgi:hypothetical protein